MIEDYSYIVQSMKLPLIVRNRLRMERKAILHSGLQYFHFLCLNIEVQILEEVQEIMTGDALLL